METQPDAGNARNVLGRKGVDPRDVPNGYSEQKHRALRSTIADAGDLSALASNEIRVTACSRNARRVTLIGWLANQRGDGNNIALRLDMPPVREHGQNPINRRAARIV